MRERGLKRGRSWRGLVRHRLPRRFRNRTRRCGRGRRKRSLLLCAKFATGQRRQRRGRGSHFGPHNLSRNGRWCVRKLFGHRRNTGAGSRRRNRTGVESEQSESGIRVGSVRAVGSALPELTHGLSVLNLEVGGFAGRAHITLQRPHFSESPQTSGRQGQGARKSNRPVTAAIDTRSGNELIKNSP